MWNDRKTEQVLEEMHALCMKLEELAGDLDQNAPENEVIDYESLKRDAEQLTADVQEAIDLL